MKKTLIIGDIHLNHKKIRKILDKWDGPIIQLGDWFDNFGEKEEDTIETARLFKEFVHRPETITLMGNHDFHYRIKSKGSLYCSGFEFWKYETINGIVEEKDWKKLKYFHYEKNYWFSHAGISGFWFEDPIRGTTPEVILGYIQRAELALEAGEYRRIGCLYAADYYRGGNAQFGGLLWNDWNNIQMHEGVIEVVGHTPSNSIQVHKWNETSASINTDCHLIELLFINEDYSWEVVKTSEFLKT
jgi:hypothetical protein